MTNHKLIKVSLVLSWMGMIFVLSSLPAKSFPAGTTNFEEILAHIFLYAVLSFLIYQAVLSFRPKTELWKIIFFSLAITILYGISDEYHQGFVPGRYVSFSDLGFDIFGAAVGVLFYFLIRKRKTRLLLHICCAGCGAYISQLMKKNFQVILYFYNPNIYPEDEYEKRLVEARRIAKKFKLRLMAEPYDHKPWSELVRGLEQEPERGKRCRICYGERLKKTALTASALSARYFATTLTVSPHKDALVIMNIGREMAKKYGLEFLEQDFKKQDGFKKSVLLSQELGLYRQDYCGCEYSKRNLNPKF